MQTSRLQIALNNDESVDRTAVALNVELGEDGSAPAWVELIPAGEQVVGIDGRNWLNDRPQGVLDHFAALKAHNRDLPIDWEHSSEHKAPKGEAAPAAAWGVEMEIREGGAVWCRTEWTPKGLQSVTNREYRYLSPVLIYEKATGRIVGISSVGLTNKPNLNLQALNREGTKQPQEEDFTMLKKILAALGLAEGTDETTALNAVEKLKSDLATAANRAETPSLDKFVPRSDYDAVTARATNAETALADAKKADQEKEIDTAINAALAAGKITPASKDFYVASCRAEGGLVAFTKFVESAPVVAQGSDLDGKDPNKDKGLALNADQKKISAMFGNSAEDLKKYGQAGA
jgi:phage I-like protein